MRRRVLLRMIVRRRPHRLAPRAPAVAALLVLAAVAASPATTARAAGRTRAGAADSASDPIAAKVKGAVRRDGLFVTWLDRKAGKLFLELPRPSGSRSVCATVLYCEGIVT